MLASLIVALIFYKTDNFSTIRFSSGKIKREKVTQEVKAEECSRKEGQLKILLKKEIIAIIVSNFVPEQLKKTIEGC